MLRQHPFAHGAPADEDLSVDFAALTTPSDRVAVVATEPLTADEPWHAMAPGELRVFVHGADRLELPRRVRWRNAAGPGQGARTTRRRANGSHVDAQSAGAHHAGTTAASPP